MALLEQKQDAVVTQDNEVIEACYSFTLIEKRVLLLALSKIDPTKFPKASTPLKVSFDLNEWQKYYPEDNPWRTLKYASESLLGKHVTFHPKTGVVKKVNWFSSVEYHEGEGWLTMEFSRPMQVRLAGMLEQFTQINLLSVNKLTSIYSIRLYEILSQFKKTGYRVMTLKDFRFSMDCVGIYSRMCDLKRRVIDIAIREINLKTDLTITSMQNIKRGRRITGFKFYFKVDTQQDLFK